MRQQDSKTKAEKLQKIRQDFHDSLPGRIQHIQSLWHCWIVDNDNNVSLDLLQELHSLAGTSGTFGYTALSEHSRMLEDELRKVTGDAWKNRMADLFNAFDTFSPDFSPGPDSPTLPFQQRSKINSKIVAVLEDDIALAAEIKSQLETYGWSVEHFLSVDEGLPFLKQTPVAAIVADLSLAEGEL